MKKNEKEGSTPVGGIAIMGSIGRGAGKTSLLRAHLEEVNKPKRVLIVGADNNEAHSIAVKLAEKFKDTTDLIMCVDTEIPDLPMVMEAIDIEGMFVLDSMSEIAIGHSSIETRILKCIKEPPVLHETSTKTNNKSYHKFLPDVRGDNRRKKGKK